MKVKLEYQWFGLAPVPLGESGLHWSPSQFMGPTWAPRQPSRIPNLLAGSHQLGGMFPPTCAAAWRAAMPTHSSALRIIATEQSCVGAAVCLLAMRPSPASALLCRNS